MQILLSRITFHMYIYHIHEMLTEYVETEKQCSLYDYPLYQIQLSAFPDQKHNSLPQNFFSLFFFHITLSFYHRLNKVVHEQEDTSILTDLSNQQFRICSTQLGKSGVCEKIQIMHIWLPILPKKYYYFSFELKKYRWKHQKDCQIMPHILSIPVGTLLLSHSIGSAPK